MAIGDGMRIHQAMNSRFPSRLDRAAPAIAFGILLAMFGISGHFLGKTDKTTPVVPIQEVFANIPGQLIGPAGTWIRNRSVPVPSSQARILDLSAYFSCEYLRLGGFPSVTATLFIAYCNDGRSMVGHHPPNCYPSSGWLMDVAETRSLEVARRDGKTISAKIYRFSREGYLADNLQVVSGFFTSGGLFFGTLDEILEVVQPTLLGGSGLFQFQILLQGGYSNADVEGYAIEILEAIPEVVFDQAIGTPEFERDVDGLGAKS